MKKTETVKNNLPTLSDVSLSEIVNLEREVWRDFKATETRRRLLYGLCIDNEALSTRGHHSFQADWLRPRVGENAMTWRARLRAVGWVSGQSLHALEDIYLKFGLVKVAPEPGLDGQADEAIQGSVVWSTV